MMKALNIGNLFLGLVFIAAGVAFLKFHFQVANAFGRDNWFEYKLGSGATYGIVKLVGLLSVIFGLLMVVGLHDNLLRIIFAPLLAIFQQ